jgi:adenosylcobinamide-GDP ribazoletransferase
MALAVLTGGLHEDGLADVTDALRRYRTRQRILEILQDSRVGAHGALALVFSVTIRWQALAELEGDIWLRVPAACGIARASMVLLAAVSRPAGDGLGAAFIQSLPRSSAWFVGIMAVFLAALAGWPAGAFLIAANLAVGSALRAWFHARLGGVTGDCLGFTCQVSEALNLTILTCV